MLKEAQKSTDEVLGDKVIAYVVLEGDEISLRVNEGRTPDKCHRYPLDYAALMRLQAECAPILLTLFHRQEGIR